MPKEIGDGDRVVGVKLGWDEAEISIFLKDALSGPAAETRTETVSIFRQM